MLERHVDGKDIKIISEFLPGDESIKYTSPYAGGNFLCITGDDTNTLRRDRTTYENLPNIQRVLGEQCGLDRCESHEYFATRPSVEKIESYRSYLDNYKELSELPVGFEFGILFLSWSFNCPLFLSSLLKYVQSRGVKVQRQAVENIADAYDADTTAVVNCTGLGARSLEGVADKAVFSTRGQVVVVKAPHINENQMFWGKDFATYAIKRPHSNDQLVLGGFLQHGDWTAATFREQTEDILQRVSQAFPKLLSENPRGPKIADLEVLRVVAGLRPSREGGVRIEKERHKNGLLVHNYGASGYGYQCGYAMGAEAAQLLLGASKL